MYVCLCVCIYTLSLPPQDKRTALMVAAIEGNKEMTSVLIKHKASVTAKDRDGCTAVYLAASSGNYEALKMLAQQPMSDVNIKNVV